MPALLRMMILLTMTMLPLMMLPPTKALMVMMIHLGCGQFGPLPASIAARNKAQLLPTKAYS